MNKIKKSCLISHSDLSIINKYVKLPQLPQVDFFNSLFYLLYPPEIFIKIKIPAVFVSIVVSD